MVKTTNILILVCTLIVLGSVSSASCNGILEDDWDPQAYKSYYRPIPVLFAHGFAKGQRDNWYQSIDKLEQYFDQYFFYDRSRSIGEIISDLGDKGSVPYLEAISFGETIYDRNDSIDKQIDTLGWATLLGFRTDEMLGRYLDSGSDINESKINIVAHSMGGLAAREYILHGYDSQNQENISKLITLGTPHTGSPLASLAFYIASNRRQSKIFKRMVIGVPELLETGAINYLGDHVLAIIFDREDGGEAVYDMRLGSSFLTQLNSDQSIFSGTTKYYAMYGKISAFRNRLLGFGRDGGDKVVSLDSQRGDGVLNLSAPAQLLENTDHGREIQAATDGNYILKFLDIDDPVTVIRPTISESVTGEMPDIEANFNKLLTQGIVKVIGEVDNEYLPADTIVEFKVFDKDGNEVYEKLGVTDSNGLPVVDPVTQQPQKIYLRPYVNLDPVPSGFEEDMWFSNKKEALRSGIYRIEATTINPAHQVIKNLSIADESIGTAELSFNQDMLEAVFTNVPDEGETRVTIINRTGQTLTGGNFFIFYYDSATKSYKQVANFVNEYNNLLEEEKILTPNEDVLGIFDFVARALRYGIVYEGKENNGQGILIFEEESHMSMATVIWSRTFADAEFGPETGPLVEELEETIFYSWGAIVGRYADVTFGFLGETPGWLTAVQIVYLQIPLGAEPVQEAQLKFYIPDFDFGFPIYYGDDKVELHTSLPLVIEYTTEDVDLEGIRYSSQPFLEGMIGGVDLILEVIDPTVSLVSSQEHVVDITGWYNQWILDGVERVTFRCKFELTEGWYIPLFDDLPIGEPFSCSIYLREPDLIEVPIF